jgi:Nucleotidyl transferase AbiEii toxin, Type IV TA system
VKVVDALQGVVRRVARGPTASRWVLRGSLVTRRFAGLLRPVFDVDFLDTGPFDAEATTASLGAVLARDAGDGIAFSVLGAEVIWAETAFPGVRAQVEARAGAEALPIQVDVGFGDPLVPDPELVDDGTGHGVLSCRAETLFGWKVHGLYDRGPGQWRPKDLFDVWLLGRHAPLDPEALPRAVRSAFESRGTPLAVTAPLLAGRFATSPWSRRKWASFRKDRGGDVPEDPAEIVADVAAALRPVIGPMLAGADT